VGYLCGQGILRIQPVEPRNRQFRFIIKFAVLFCCRFIVTLWPKVRLRLRSSSSKILRSC